METNLHFVITKIDGTTVTQDIQVPSDAVEPAINQMMIQFAQVGVLKKEGTKHILLAASQIALVECEPSALVIATPIDTPKTASLKKIYRKGDL